VELLNKLDFKNGAQGNYRGKACLVLSN